MGENIWVIVVASFLVVPSLLLFISVFVTGKGDNIKNKTKYYGLSNFSGFFIILSLVILVISTIFSISTKISRSAASSDSSTSAADGFVIDDYTVYLDVDENYNVKVTEQIDVNFTNPGHHGIYKFIPSWLEYTSKDGETTSRKAEIKDLRAIGEEFSLDTVKGKERVKIGSANTTLPVGLHPYTITYNYNFNGDLYDGYDEFIFHAFGDFWGTEIKNAKVVVLLPKEIDSKTKISFFADKKRSSDITDFVDYKIDGKTIIATVNSNYKLMKSLTVDIELPDGYFSQDSGESYGYFSLVMCIICIISVIVSFLIWLKYGKDLDKVPETVEFYPPEGFDVAELGYLYKGDTGRKLSAATILALANKEYIKVKQDTEGNIIVSKNIDIDFDSAIERELKLIKNKDLEKNANCSEEVKSFMKEYFPSKKTIEATVDSNISKVMPSINYLVENGYIKIDHDSKNDYTEEALENIKKDIEKKNSKTLELTKTEEIVFNKLFEEKTEVKLNEHHTLYTVFTDVGNEVRNKFDDKVNDLTSYKFSLIVSLWLFICTILWSVSYIFIKDMNPKFSFVYVIAFGANIGAFVLAILMKRKTQYGEEIKAKINGFRNYLEVARKDQLEMLVEQNPNYFFDILPFAYVLDVSKKWSEKFADIPLPERDIGNFDYTNTDSLDSISSSFYYPSSSGGGSGCGGGCSSCGGGCSSCGGGGGW